MAQEEAIKLFEGKHIRYVWDEEAEKYYFSVVDVVGVLTDQNTARGATIYWAVLKKRLKNEGADELITNCKQLKMEAADGKKYITDVADADQLLRIIQSIPSKKAEPFKQWLAQVGAERIRQMQDPERSIEQAMRDYRRLGYSENWINQRIKTIEIRKGLTDEWKRGGVTEESEYAQLTDLMSWSDCWACMVTPNRIKGIHPVRV
ncbi:MAG: Bro-N domain-containing protein [Paludibacteraceae bacterium]|nr:Bro-N domain-containing protein [Paludibacteraceae bacterium]